MKRSLSLGLVLAAFGMSVSPGPQATLAQAPPPRPAINTTARPTVSPYLNLLRGGQSTALNYYNLVRPQFDFQNSINTLQQEVTSNQQSISQLGQANNTLPDTGHPVQFM